MIIYAKQNYRKKKNGKTSNSLAVKITLCEYQMPRIGDQKRLFIGIFFQNQGRIGTAEAKRVGHGHLDRGLAGGVGHIVQVTFFRLIFIVDGWRNHIAIHTQGGKHRLNAAGAAQQMAGHRFGGTDRHLVGIVLKYRFDRPGFIQIVELGGGPMGIETVFTALSVYRDMIPPTINYENQAEECDLDYVPNTARQAPVKVAMTNSFGFGGTNATLILKKYADE